jgi:ribosome-binding protein aMBF1 (putative translation factor)
MSLTGEFDVLATFVPVCRQAINEKPSIINDYESGKAIPNPQILSKMSRILGVTLKKGK